ncbi:efflux RND transporter periplasmic adaptor subunit [Desulfolutivibrio sp.]|uniref:efflux RND transporter periplasmic adaptor subunit n=1 Tax=Desulfolutivibrio sp. TaxID=2773296 RepID=UPI002F96B905
MEVTVVQAAHADAPLNVDGIGHVYAYNTVKVRPQVTGYLKATSFVEGQEVKAGDLLVLIDPAPFQAKVDEAKATLLRDKATAEQNHRDWVRYKDLVEKAVISQEDYEKKRTDYQQSKEQVRMDEASLADAEISLSWCSIASPVDGICSLQQIKTGNLVEENKDTILTVNQIRPINIQISVAEKDLPDLRAHAVKTQLPINVRFPGKDAPASTGVLTVINNAVDTTTGMITIQGEFQNENRLLWPGQFVEASVVLAMIPGTILLPSDALMETQDGISAFVVTAQKTVEIRKVKTGRKIGSNTVIESGINAGDTVITSGQIKLFPGAPVTIVNEKTYNEGPVPPADGTTQGQPQPKGDGQNSGQDAVDKDRKGS